jgi:hypothetical protein
VIKALQNVRKHKAHDSCFFLDMDYIKCFKTGALSIKQRTLLRHVTKELDGADSGVHSGKRVGKPTCQPRGLIPICRNRSRKVETVVTSVMTKGRNPRTLRLTNLEPLLYINVDV